MKMRGEVQHQLRMFMTGPEIQQQYGGNPAERRGTESEPEMWGRKVEEASRPEGSWAGLRQSIKREGVRYPVTVWHGEGAAMLAEGHHRVAVSAKDKPQSYVPVHHQGVETNWFA